MRAFITGAASGLGRELALQLTKRHRQEGVSIAIADLNLAGAQETAAMLTQAGAQALVFRCDVTDVAQLENAAAQTYEAFGGVDLVVNNAGVAAGGHVGEVPLADWQWVLDINLKGVIHGCHVFVPRMKQQFAATHKRTAILNIASGAGFVSLPEMAAYNVSKAGVIALSETLYTELAPSRIHVSVLCPTFFKTNLLNTFRAPSERQKKLAEQMFKWTTMGADDVARFALNGLDKRKLMLVPQLEAALLWRLKRLAPALFFKAIAAQQTHDFAGRWFAKK